MKFHGDGVLPRQYIKELIEEGHILTPELRPDQIQPCSLDLRLGDVAVNVKSSELPTCNETIEEIAMRNRIYDFHLRDGAVLNKGLTYLMRCKESLDLPAGISSYSDTKSSSGRGGLLSPSCADGISKWGIVNKPGPRDIYLESTPLRWNTRVAEGTAVSQMRFTVGDPRMTRRAINDAHKVSPLLFTESGVRYDNNALPIEDDAVVVTLDLEADNIGYKAIAGSTLIYDMAGGRGAMEGEVDKFWEKITRPPNGRLTLEPDTLYLLGTRERFAFSPYHCGYLEPYDVTAVEGRSHFAGFADAGFGYSSDTSFIGAPITLEVYLVHKPLTLKHGQPFGRMRWLSMLDAPQDDAGNLMLYGRDSNYQMQPRGGTLAKQFLK